MEHEITVTEEAVTVVEANDAATEAILPVDLENEENVSEDIQQQLVGSIQDAYPEGSTVDMQTLLNEEAKKHGMSQKDMRRQFKKFQKKMDKQVKPMPTLEEAAEKVYGVICDSLVETGDEESALSQTHLSLYTGRKFLTKPSAETLSSLILELNEAKGSESIVGLFVEPIKEKKRKGKPSGHSLCINIPAEELERQRKLLSDRAKETIVVKEPVSLEINEEDLPTTDEVTDSEVSIVEA